ncbi:hypothetical protein [Caudoviricetes sp.]|nr:hypothetical protein [Caudoviricetes sp.]
MVATGNAALSNPVADGAHADISPIGHRLCAAESCDKGVDRSDNHVFRVVHEGYYSRSMNENQVWPFSHCE